MITPLLCACVCVREREWMNETITGYMKLATRGFDDDAGNVLIKKDGKRKRDLLALDSFDCLVLPFTRTRTRPPF